MEIIRIGHFLIFKYKEGYIIHNTRYNFKNAHTHINIKSLSRSLYYCKEIVHNVLNKRTPDRYPDLTRAEMVYILESHIRISDDEQYKRLLRELKESRSDYKPYYINIQKGRVVRR